MKRKFSLAGAVCALLLIGATAADAQGFYPRDWAWGRSGLFSRDYITPYSNEPGYVWGTSPASGRSSRGGQLIFAAATVDSLCQQNGSPTVTILNAPPGAQISTDIGSFVASANDGGSNLCIGRIVRGTRLFYQGRATGSRIVVRVAYPTKGLTYDHMLTVR